MKVIVTSHNPGKFGAVREAFLSRFPMDEIQLIPVNVKSGVPDQPMSDRVTRRGVYTQALILALIPFVHELWL